MSSYYTEAIATAKRMNELADAILATKRARADWTQKNEGKSIFIGYHAKVFREDGLVDPQLAGVQREILAAIDDRLHRLRGEFEGLRYKMSQIGKQGGAA